MLLVLLVLSWIAVTQGEDAAVHAQVQGFIERQRLNAAKSYDLLFGDGEGVEGTQPPPTVDAFIEHYVTKALVRETARIRREKGYQEDPQPKGEVLLSNHLAPGALAKLAKKDAPTTVEEEIDQLLAYKKQRQAVQRLAGSETPTLELEDKPGRDLSIQLEEGQLPISGRSWTTRCAAPIYASAVVGGTSYGHIPGCCPSDPSPNTDPTDSTAASPSCARVVLQDVANTEELRVLRSGMDRAFIGLFHQGAETLLVPEATTMATRRRLGNDAADVLEVLLLRVRRAVAAAVNISSDRLFYSGSLLKRMDWPPPTGKWQVDPHHNSFNPHIDKANIASYDWSALLYLNDVGRDFGGGEIVFFDEDAKSLVKPMGGKVVAFSSGVENLHQVLPMHWGRRDVLSIWFTCSAAHQHPELSPKSRSSEEL